LLHHIITILAGIQNSPVFDFGCDTLFTDLLVVLVMIHVAAFHTMVCVAQMWLENSKLSMLAIPVNNFFLLSSLQGRLVDFSHGLAPVTDK
jgi:hypothetical protein